jgi:CDP-glucose 4,6-dehydratase
MKVNGFEWKGKKVLVTGATGFKGAWACAAALALGARVHATRRNHIHPASAFALFGLEDQVTSASVDISDRQDVYDLINTAEPDLILHMAAKALVPVGLRDPRRALDVNIMGTANLIEACRRIHVCNRLLICSTDHVFGNVKPDDLPPNGFDERDRVSYGGPYDTSKAAMELVVRMYHSTYWGTVPAIGITRCANVFGFGDTNPRRVVPLFVTSAMSDKNIPLRYRLNGRQFIYVTDAIAGYFRAVSSLGEPGDVKPAERSPFTPTYHFAIEKYPGTDKPYIEMKALAELTGRLFDAPVTEVQCVDYAPNENRIQALSCQSTRAELGWRTEVPLADGLRRLGEWYAASGDTAALRRLMQDDLKALTSSLGDTRISAGAASVAA